MPKKMKEGLTMRFRCVPMCNAAEPAGKKSAKICCASSSNHQYDRAGQEHAVEHAHPGDARHAIPFARADVLRGHGRHSHGHGEGGHLDVVPDLHGGAEGCGRVHAEAIDERDHEYRAQGDDQHLRAHRHALLDERADDRPVDLQIRELILVQAQHVLAPVEVADEGREAHGLGDEGGERGAGDPQAWNGTETEDEHRIQDDVDPDRQAA